MMPIYKQFKLTNGDEIVCEIVDQNDEIAEVIIRKTLKIVVTDDFVENVRYYSLKPWTSFQDDTNELISLNSVHIIGETTPSDTMLMHYANALIDVDKYNAIKAAGVSISEIHEKMKELSEEEMMSFLDEKLNEVSMNSMDSAEMSNTENIIIFNPKGTRH